MYRLKNINGIRKRISPIYNKDWAFVLKKIQNERRLENYSSVFFLYELSYMVIIIYDNYQFSKNFFCFKFILSNLGMIEPSTNS